VLDEAGRLYLYRYWAYQEALARGLLGRASWTDTARQLDGTSAAARGLRERLDALFPRSTALAPGEIDGQRVAASVALLRRLCVVSGGPGTGKTTTVTKILALLVESAAERTPRIELAAPTGKAAARMVEAIRQAKTRLGLEERVAAAIPDDAKTLHRLLGYRRGRVSFRHGPEHPLPVDVLVVDEASMVDLALMAKLVAALPPAARLLLVGDRDQLASVEAGAVLGDIGAGPVTRFSPAMAERIESLTGESVERVGPSAASAGGSAGDVAMGGDGAPAILDSVVLLTRSYRFGPKSGIGAAAAAVNAGDAERLLAVLGDDRYPDVRLETHASLVASIRNGSLAGLGPYLAADDPLEALAAFDRFRVLSAHRTGPFGVGAMNATIESLLAEAGRIRPRGPWYRGRPVLVTENDYGLRLFNGDVGITWPDPDRPGAFRVVFASDGGVRHVAPARLPAHETAFAMTVHKSQGSEFDDVLLVLPAEVSGVLTRELIYTGLTRARRRVEVVGGAEILRAGVASTVQRSSGLRDALWGRACGMRSGDGATETARESVIGEEDARSSRGGREGGGREGGGREGGDSGQLSLF
jgi:exodeoxyribonuclease V alpha subunit